MESVSLVQILALTLASSVTKKKYSNRLHLNFLIFRENSNLSIVALVWGLVK